MLMDDCLRRYNSTRLPSWDILLPSVAGHEHGFTNTYLIDIGGVFFRLDLMITEQALCLPRINGRVHLLSQIAIGGKPGSPDEYRDNVVDVPLGTITLVGEQCRDLRLCSQHTKSP